MKTKFILMFVLILLSLTFVMADETTWGTFKKSTTVELFGTCALLTCNQTNFTEILYPNSTRVVSDVQANMTNNVFNYTFTHTEALGIYTVHGVSGNATETIYWVGDFEVNTVGFQSTTARITVVNVGVWAIFVIAILMFIGFITTSKEKDEKDEQGEIIGIKNQRPIKWTFLLLFILFLAIGFHTTFINIYNEIGDIGVGAIYDQLAAFTTYLFWFTFGVLIIMWVLITVATLAKRKHMKQAEATGNQTNFR